MDTLFGVINLDKPSGLSSRAAINQLLRQVRPAKLGHGGTLDPLASGVLLVLVGKATRLMPYVQRMKKKYLATFQLGVVSDTEDVQGTVTPVRGAVEPTRQQVLAELPNWIGTIKQLPPAYSALKVNGDRAYQLARKGQEVKLAARDIQIHELELDHFEFPLLRLQICCGSGTYVRSLGRDIAHALGTGAVMSQLVRTSIGEYCLPASVSLDELHEQGVASHLLPARSLVAELPSLTLEPAQWELLANGRVIDYPHELAGEEFSALDIDGNLLGILAPDGPGRVRPIKSFGL